MPRYSSVDFSTLLEELTRSGAFPSAFKGQVSVIQTHASGALLTPQYVYKLKKPKDYGFFDYSTPALRRHFCIQEVLLNARLAPQAYLGVAPVLRSARGSLHFGPTLPPEDIPEPGLLYDGEEVVDYAVVMLRLSDDATLEAYVRAATATPDMLAEVARFVAAFHQKTPTDEHIAHFGSIEVIRNNWEENFEQTKPYIGRSIDSPTYAHIVDHIRSFMSERTELFANRVREGHIRDCHGDLRLQHVYLLSQRQQSTLQLPRLLILDCIEFNERFRYSDVASEIAFLAMELDASCRDDLSRIFVESYITATRDEALRELLPFYACYRAYVRGKVTSFQLDNPEVSATQREQACRDAGLLFQQAASYVGGPTRPVLLLIGGLMGTGKSTLSYAIEQEVGWALFSSDTIRKRLARLDPSQASADAFGEGLYSSEWTARTYAALLDEAKKVLKAGRSVILDASFLRRAHRLAALQIAMACNAEVYFVECTCPRDLVLQRLASRWQSHISGRPTTGIEALSASDGRPDLYERQLATWEAFNPQEEVGISHVEVSTASSLAINVEQVLTALRQPHLACYRLPIS